MKVKEESEKAGLKLNIQKMKIMASSPITSQQVDGEKMETDKTVSLGSKITVDSNCSHEIKGPLLPGRKDKSRQHIQRQRHHFAYKSLYSQKYDFSSSHVQM